MLRCALVTWSGLRELAPDDRLLRDALARRGADVRAEVWDDPRADWRSYDAIVIRSTWDYHKRIDEFRAWIDRMEGLPLYNRPAVLRRNTHKGYLLELQEQGIAVVPTMLVRQGERVDDVPWSDVIVKPAVSATGYRTTRTRGSQRTAAGGLRLSAESRGHLEPGTRHHVADCDVLVQPFMPEVVRDGELSFVFLGREFSHAVRKRPRDDDFRVQTDFGGSVEPFAPSAELIAQAETIAATLGDDWLYARVDCVERDGRLVLMELEATEPSLFLDWNPSAPERFADTIWKVV